MTQEEKIDKIYYDFRNKRISREEGIRGIMDLGGITRIGADDILTRWPTIKRES